MIEQPMSNGQGLTADQRSRAVRVVAAAAQSAGDLAELLEALGLYPSEAADPGSAPDQRRAARRAEQRGNRRLRISELTAMLETAANQPKAGSGPTARASSGRRRPVS